MKFSRIILFRCHLAFPPLYSVVSNLRIRAKKSILSGFGNGCTLPGPLIRDCGICFEAIDWLRRGGNCIHQGRCVIEYCADVVAEACCFLPGLTHGFGGQQMLAIRF